VRFWYEISEVTYLSILLSSGLSKQGFLVQYHFLDIRDSNDLSDEFINLLLDRHRLMGLLIIMLGICLWWKIETYYLVLLIDKIWSI
jgi:uncharacterized membrane protein